MRPTRISNTRNARHRHSTRSLTRSADSCRCKVPEGSTCNPNGRAGFCPQAVLYPLRGLALQATTVVCVCHHQLSRLSRTQVSQHNAPQDCWVSFLGQVFLITPLVMVCMSTIPPNAAATPKNTVSFVFRTSKALMQPLS